MPAVEIPMIVKVTMKVFLRPVRSPSLPKMMAPKGLTNSPTEKVASVASRAAVGLSFGKKRVEMIVARLPNKKKSYHSIKVPAEDAVIILIRLFFDVGVWSKSLFLSDAR